MPYRPLRRTAIATAVALASGLVSVQAAGAAGVDSTSPVISVGTTSIDEYGPPGDLDINVTASPAADAYIRLALDSGANLEQLRITDDTGTRLPIIEVPGQPAYINVGADDSDHNGIPGGPLPDGTAHLHVSAGYLAPRLALVTGYIIDGASGKPIVRTRVGAGGEILVGEPLLSANWTGSNTTRDADAIAIGSSQPARASLETQMAMVSPPPTTHTRWTIPADQITGAGYTTAQLTAALHIGYSPNTGTYTAQQWTVTGDGSLQLDLPAHDWLPSAPQNGTESEDLHITADWGLPTGKLTSVFETLGADGTPYAQWHQLLEFTADTVPAAHRAALYARDSAGVLWQYQATPLADHPGALQARTRIGGGWGVYTTVTALGPLKANGTGDIVARDGAGVLWYYRGTGDPAAPFQLRTRIGGGWNMYTQIAGVADMTGDGHSDLVARDTAGVLWLYRGTGRTDAPFAPRTRIGGGWQIYNQVTGVGDMTGDGHSDLLARDTTGHLWYYRGTGNPAAPYAPRVQNGFGWNIYNALT